MKNINGKISPKFKQNLLFKLKILAKLSSLILEDTVAINTAVLPLWRDTRNAKNNFKPYSDKNPSTTSKLYDWIIQSNMCLIFLFLHETFDMVLIRNISIRHYQ